MHGASTADICRFRRAVAVAPVTNAGVALLSTSCALRCKIEQVTSKAAGPGKTAAEARAAGFRSVPEVGPQGVEPPQPATAWAPAGVETLFGPSLALRVPFCMAEGSAYASIWFQKFAYLKNPFPRHRADRPSGPEVVCSQSLLSRDREGAVQGLSAYKRSRTYGTKH